MCAATQSGKDGRGLPVLDPSSSALHGPTSTASTLWAPPHVDPAPGHALFWPCSSYLGTGTSRTFGPPGSSRDTCPPMSLDSCVGAGDGPARNSWSRRPTCPTRSTLPLRGEERDERSRPPRQPGGPGPQRPRWLAAAARQPTVVLRRAAPEGIGAASALCWVPSWLTPLSPRLSTAGLKSSPGTELAAPDRWMGAWRAAHYLASWSNLPQADGTPHQSHLPRAPPKLPPARPNKATAAPPRTPTEALLFGSYCLCSRPPEPAGPALTQWAAEAHMVVGAAAAPGLLPVEAPEAALWVGVHPLARGGRQRPVGGARLQRQRPRAHARGAVVEADSRQALEVAVSSWVVHVEPRRPLAGL